MLMSGRELPRLEGLDLHFIHKFLADWAVKHHVSSASLLGGFCHLGNQEASPLLKAVS
jgi:hypothetical protein